MPKYRVKQGKKFGPGGRYPAGTILEMSEREAKPFADILEPAPDSALVGSKQEVVPHEPLQFKNELGVEVPEDLKMMPGVLDPTAPGEEDESVSELPKEETKTGRKTAGKSTRKRSTEE